MSKNELCKRILESDIVTYISNTLKKIVDTSRNIFFMFQTIIYEFESGIALKSNENHIRDCSRELCIRWQIREPFHFH